MNLYTPVLTSPSGASLTAANWQKAGIQTATFYLETLLMKPGYDFLMTLPDLASYVGWACNVILNATLSATKSGEFYTVRSVYDGSRTSYSADDILALIKKLKPEIVILPEGIPYQHELKQPTSMTLFTPAKDASASTEGIYFSYEKITPNDEFFEQIKQYQGRPRYVSGDLNLAMMRQLAHYGVDIIESDRPAMDAFLGKVYSEEGELSLQDSIYSMQFKPIDKTCECSTCTQSLTRAYLHHLYEQTPLLCQRLLVIHNVHYTMQAYCS